MTSQTLIFKDERSRRNWQVSYSEQSVPFPLFSYSSPKRRTYTYCSSLLCSYYFFPDFHPSYINIHWHWIMFLNPFLPRHADHVRFDGMSYIFERNNISRQMVQLIHSGNGEIQCNFPVLLLLTRWLKKYAVLYWAIKMWRFFLMRESLFLVKRANIPMTDL